MQMWRFAEIVLGKRIALSATPQYARLPALSAIARFGAPSLIRYYLRRSVIYFFRGCPANVRAAAQEILESAEPVASARLHPNPASPHMRSPNSRRAQGLRSAMAPSIAVPEPVSAECDIADAVDPRVNRTKEEPPPVGAHSVQSLLARSFPAAAAEAERVDARPAGRKMKYLCSGRSSLLQDRCRDCARDRVRLGAAASHAGDDERRSDHQRSN